MEGLAPDQISEDKFKYGGRNTRTHSLNLRDLMVPIRPRYQLLQRYNDTSFQLQRHKIIPLSYPGGRRNHFIFSLLIIGNCRQVKIQVLDFSCKS